MTFLPTDTPSIFATPAEISPAAEPRHAATGPSPPACYPSGNRSDALQLRRVHVAVDAVDAFRWALVDAVQRAGPDTTAGAVKARIIACRGNQTRNIAKVAAARKLLTLMPSKAGTTSEGMNAAGGTARTCQPALGTDPKVPTPSTRVPPAAPLRNPAVDLLLTIATYHGHASPP